MGNQCMYSTDCSTVCVFAELGIYLHKACVSILICTMGGT